MHTEAEAIAKIVAETTHPTMIDLCEKPGPMAAALPPGMQLTSIKRLIDEYREEPERRKGTARVERVESLIDLTNRFKDGNSALFARGEINGSEIRASLMAVLNYNPAVPGDEPAETTARFGDHRVVYDFPVSKDFQAWIDRNKTPMGQAEFAVFIEDRIGDVIADIDGKASIAGADVLKPNFATPAELLELSRGLEIRVGETVKAVVRLSSGESQMQFVSEHLDKGGDPIKIPDFFLIAVPVFEMGVIYRLPARLRYRVREGKTTFFFELYRTEKAFDLAFSEACASAAEKTDLPLFYGTPEV